MFRNNTFVFDKVNGIFYDVTYDGSDGRKYLCMEWNLDIDTEDTDAFFNWLDFVADCDVVSDENMNGVLYILKGVK